MQKVIHVGTAGWTIPRAVSDRFPSAGSALQRYAARFSAAEINSTFRRSHQPQTFARWANAVREGAPRMYYSAYDASFLSRLANAILQSAAKEVWCIFDNTASGAATANALEIQTRLTSPH